MDISFIKKEVEQFNEPIRSPSEQNEGENQSATQENVQLTEPTDFRNMWKKKINLPMENSHN